MQPDKWCGTASAAAGGADGGTRTRTLQELGILSPVCLPVPPRPLKAPLMRNVEPARNGFARCVAAFTFEKPQLLRENVPGARSAAVRNGTDLLASDAPIGYLIVRHAN